MPHSHQIHKSAPFTLIILIILIAAGCRLSTGDRGGAQGDADLVGVEWQLVQIEASEASVTRDDLARDVTLEFSSDEHDRVEGGRLVSGYAPCNGFSAGYRTEGEGSISFDDIVGTFMACDDDIMMHERLLFQGLDEATAYTIESLTLQIISENITLTYEAS
jgi:heat shock protein HslJ